MELKGEYNGYKIHYSDYDKIHVIRDGEIERRCIDSIDTAKKWIDAKYKEKFNRVAVLVKPWNERHYVPATATSLDGNSVWITKQNNKRSKESIRGILLDTPENRSILKQIGNITQEYESTIKELEGKLENFDPEAMKSKDS